MDYFKQGFTAVMGQQPEEQSGAETVERLVDRLQSSTLLEDRRDAVRALRALSKEYQLEVGTRGMAHIVDVLQNDSSDVEIVRFAIETLINLMTTEPVEGNNPPPETDLGVQFTEIFVKDHENVSLLLNLLEEVDFYVRFHAVQLLTLLLTNRSQKLQDCILASPMGVVRLMDLLSDTRDIIRNEGLLLLIQLTSSNPSIQKIVTFENAFERLIDICKEEGQSDGGIIVQDCLHMMHNLLRNNVSNQNYFRETSCIPHIASFFDMEYSGSGWTDQKITNILLMLELLRLLVSSNNPSTNINQNIMCQNHIVKSVLDMGLADAIPEQVKTQALNTLAELVRGFKPNQEFLMSTVSVMDNTHSHPSIICLLLYVVDSRRPFEHRYAALYCFESYLHQNEDAQAFMISTLSRANDGTDDPYSVGSLILGSLFGVNDPLSNWFAALALSKLFMGNISAKEACLKVSMILRLGESPVSLMQQCMQALMHSGPQNLRTKVGLYVLLSVWLYECPFAVKTFVQIPSAVPYLVEQVEHHSSETVSTQSLGAFILGVCACFNDTEENTEFNRTAITHIISHRLGKDRFAEKLDSLLVSDAFTASARARDSVFTSSDSIFFDPQYSVFARPAIENVKRVSFNNESNLHVGGGALQKSPSANNTSVEYHDSVVTSYKELIRSQDEELRALKAQMANMTVNTSDATSAPASGNGKVHDIEIEKLNEALQSAQQQITEKDFELTQVKGELEMKTKECDGLVSSYNELNSHLDSTVGAKDSQIQQLVSF